MKILYFNILYFLLIFWSCSSQPTKEIHVSKLGNNSNNGALSSPLLTISKAADIAIPGDIIIIHEGTYREYINPNKGGISENERITFKAATGENVFIKGSETINNWIKKDNYWEVVLPASFFNDYNPYVLNIDGDFQNYGQWHHRGDVYINNSALNEVKTINQVESESYTWHTSTSENETTITANFGNENPNTELTEINVRELLFFAKAQDIDFITIDGLRFLQAAPNWQAPNEGSSDKNRLSQVGAVGCNMGKHWIIENCEISYSKTAGIMMGESCDNQEIFEDIDAFGDHIIRNNVITKCGEYGIAGQKGLSRSTIIGNRIEDINFRNEFGGFETAGIKIWNCTDVTIENNLVRRITSNQNFDSSMCYCIWVDFANQGTRITRNFLEGSEMTTTPLFLEANIGPTLVDNNIIIDRSDKAIQIFSGGSVLAHNLFVDCNFKFEIQEFGNDGSGARIAYTMKKHSLEVSGRHKVGIENNKLYNNIFAGGTGPVNFDSDSGIGNKVDYNLYIGGTKPGTSHSNVKTSNFDFSYTVSSTKTGVNFSFEIDNSFENISSPCINADLVGIIPLVEQSIEDKFGKAITINQDFNKIVRTNANPIVGPLENLKTGKNIIKIGPE